MNLIKDKWISLQREAFQQRAVLSDLAEDSDFSKLKMEITSKIRDWEQLRSLCSSSAAVSFLELGDVDMNMKYLLRSMIER